MSALAVLSSKRVLPSFSVDDLPRPGFRPPWAELSGWRKVRRSVFWVSMAGVVGLVVSAETSGSDLNLQADGTKRPKDVEPKVAKAQPQHDQAGEDPADEKRGEPEQQEGNAASAAT